MVSNIIVNALSGAQAGLGLTASKDLFAEQARGDKNVLVSTTAQTGDRYLPFERTAPVNVLVTGYDTLTGSRLSEAICNKILSLEGNTLSYGTETYVIQAVHVRNWPTLLPDPDKTTITANIELTYKLTTS